MSSAVKLREDFSAKPLQDLVEVDARDRREGRALAIEPLHLLGPVDRNPPARHLAEPAVDEAGRLPHTSRRAHRRNVRSLTPSSPAASS